MTLQNSQSQPPSSSKRETLDKIKKGKIDKVASQAINTGSILVIAPEPTQLSTIIGIALILGGTTVKILIAIL